MSACSQKQGRKEACNEDADWQCGIKPVIMCFYLASRTYAQLKCLKEPKCFGAIGCRDICLLYYIIELDESSYVVHKAKKKKNRNHEPITQDCPITVVVRSFSVGTIFSLYHQGEVMHLLRNKSLVKGVYIPPSKRFCPWVNVHFPLGVENSSHMKLHHQANCWFVPLYWEKKAYISTADMLKTAATHCTKLRHPLYCSWSEWHKWQAKPCRCWNPAEKEQGFHLGLIRSHNLDL